MELLSHLKTAAKNTSRKLGLEISRVRPQDDALKNCTKETEKLFCKTVLLKDEYLKIGKGQWTPTEHAFFAFCLSNFTRSRAQIFQDLMVQFFLNEKKSGFFVEFGATNGMGLSNTYLLEKEYEWNGILAEPAPVWLSSLKANRNCKIDSRCVWKTSGEKMKFVEALDPDFSTIGDFKLELKNSPYRRDGREISVDTVSLLDLLRDHSAPKKIDFLSVDTEGSELEILKAFDFSQHEISILAVEHNYVEPNRSQLKQLLLQNGFTQVLGGFSLWDDWYVKDELLKAGVF